MTVRADIVLLLLTGFAIYSLVNAYGPQTEPAAPVVQEQK